MKIIILILTLTFVGLHCHTPTYQPCKHCDRHIKWKHREEGNKLIFYPEKRTIVAIKSLAVSNLQTHEGLWAITRKEWGGYDVTEIIYGQNFQDATIEINAKKLKRGDTYRIYISRSELTFIMDEYEFTF